MEKKPKHQRALWDKASIRPDVFDILDDGSSDRWRTNIDPLQRWLIVTHLLIHLKRLGVKRGETIYV